MEKNQNGYSQWQNSRNTEGVRRDGCRAEGNMGNMNGSMNNMNGSGNGSARSLGSGAGDCAGVQLAMVYSPFQCWRMTYSTEEALRHGALFEELYKPLEDCRNG
jgi:hypothetical protein